MLVFEERGKPEYPEKTSQSRVENQQQTQPTYDAGSGKRTRDTLVGGEGSHHCTISGPQLCKELLTNYFLSIPSINFIVLEGVLNESPFYFSINFLCLPNLAKTGSQSDKN